MSFTAAADLSAAISSPISAGKGYKRIRSVDIKPYHEWYQKFDDVENLVLDLNLKQSCEQAAQQAHTVYNLAANMGGMGFIENNKALCMLSVLINTHMLQAAVKVGVQRYFYSSSACVYNADKQKEHDVTALKEADAYPAMPEDGYGWEKLFSERMCRHFREDFGLWTRVARFHNVYGPFGTWDGGREKAPAAICRKVIEAKVTGKHEINIWGDGLQTRSFMYIDDCLKGIQMILESDVTRADQHRLQRTGEHQSAGRYRRKNRRHETQTQPTTSAHRRASAAATATTP